MPFATHNQLNGDYVAARNPEEHEAQLPEDEVTAYEERKDLSRKVVEKRQARARDLQPFAVDEGDVIFEDHVQRKTKFYLKSALLRPLTLTPRFLLSKTRLMVGNFNAEDRCLEFFLVKLDQGDDVNQDGVISQILADPLNENKISLSRKDLKRLCKKSGPIYSFLKRCANPSAAGAGESDENPDPRALTLANEKFMFKCRGRLVLDTFKIPNSRDALAMFTFWEEGYNRSRKNVRLSMNFAAFQNLVFVAIPLMNAIFESYLMSLEAVAAQFLKIEPPLLLEGGNDEWDGSDDDDHVSDSEDDDDDVDDGQSGGGSK